MKAIAVKNSEYDYEPFKKGDLLEIRNNAVYLRGIWLCNIDSKFFEENFVLASEGK